MDLNSLPRPARSASNQEVRQGSREWPCHSWDAGKRVRASSPAPKKQDHLLGGLVFCGMLRAKARKGTSAARKTCRGTFWCPCACRGAAAPRASLVACSKIETPSERMVFSFWNIAADGFELAASTCAKRVKSRGEAGFPRMALPFVGCREASSSLVARSKKTRPPFGWSCFLWHAAGQGSKGYERSEKNVPGHVLVPVCVSRRGSAASEPRRPRARVQNEVRLARPVSSGGGGSCRRYGYPPAR